ncbi:molybdenum cofactor guanylyltransferase [Curtobacterium sp. 20TX0008]|uniref:molybdenum cofactor guanylyltransferase n=1 Tax=Curtobacterium sp. 20TX0008 TaxID=3022018 RepID=UPI002330E620|nr:NTP transferase domain-containing protein [Curtobacterium sp. 20TX0008]MDB6427147.1 NTP transferase domain-containing protein [Curtobacterium sp. 20TX0008]
MTSPTAPHHDAVLLAGGRATRMGGIDKTALVAGSVALSDHAVAAAAGARRTVLVGLRAGRGAPAGVVHTREDPPLGGPVAAIAAGLAAVADPAPWTLVLACDLVRPEPAAALLLDAAGTAPDDTDGVVAVDEDGRRQHLLALYRSDALRAAVRALGDPTGAAVRRLTDGLRLVEVPLPAALCADVDEPEDATRATADARLLD